jgi:hypothetical protein
MLLRLGSGVRSENCNQRSRSSWPDTGLVATALLEHGKWSGDLHQVNRQVEKLSAKSYEGSMPQSWGKRGAAYPLQQQKTRSNCPTALNSRIVLEGVALGPAQEEVDCSEEMDRDS